ncbi:MAG: Crp/Fnr family transcriptional regulator [Microscillaceae bacterium]|nr:Crp/Fnr family transcriptional regulator [Microscillaceae bacterium]
MLQTIKSHFLKNHTLLSNLQEPQLEDLHRISRIKELKNGQGIKLNDKEIYLLIEGKLKVSEIDAEGNEIIKEIVSEGGVFGDISRENRASCEFVQALSYRVLLCVIPAANFEWFLERNPSLAVKFSKAVWTKFRLTESKYANLVLKDARARLINFFKEWALKEGIRDGKKFTVKNYLTHEEVASLICTTRVTVTTILNKLRKEGIIRYSKKIIEIPDIQALR